MRALTPRTVTAQVDGQEIWSGPITQTLTTFNLPPLVVTTGHAELELSTDTPPVLENSQPDARRLGFMIFDPKMVVSEKPALAP
jgi:hypothetical protein